MASLLGFFFGGEMFCEERLTACTEAQERFSKGLTFSSALFSRDDGLNTGHTMPPKAAGGDTIQYGSTGTFFKTGENLNENPRSSEKEERGIDRYPPGAPGTNNCQL